MGLVYFNDVLLCKPTLLHIAAGGGPLWREVSFNVRKCVSQPGNFLEMTSST